MTVRDINTLKSYFETGDVPTQAQFGDVFDTMFAARTALSPISFGLTGIGDETEIIRTTHVAANTLGVPVSYAGIASFSVQANAIIPVATSVDFAGAQVVVLNGIFGDHAGTTRQILFQIRDPATPVVVTSAAAATASGLEAGSLTACAQFFAGPGMCYLEAVSGGPLVSNRGETGLAQYGQVFKVTRSGVSTHPLSASMEDVTSMDLRTRAMPASGWITLSNLRTDPSQYNRQTIYDIGRNQVKVDGFSVFGAVGATYLEGTQQIIQVSDACDLVFSRITGLAQEGSGTYVIGLSRAADVLIEDCSVSGPGWGWMGNNNVNGLTVRNCHLNRVDVHAGGHNIFVEGGSLAGRGVLVGWGGGVVSVRNTELIDCAAIQARTDYGGMFYGSWSVSGCLFSGADPGDAVYGRIMVDLYTNQPGSAHMIIPLPRSIAVTDCTRAAPAGPAGRLVVTPVGVRLKVTAIGGHAPVSIVVNNIRSSNNWIMANRICLEDMVLPAGHSELPTISIANCHPCGIMTNADMDAGLQTLYIPAAILSGTGGLSSLVRISDVDCVTVDTLGSAGVSFRLTGASVNSLRTAAARIFATGCDFRDPVIRTGSTAIIGGARSAALRYTAIVGGRITGAWDASLVSALSGVIVTAGARATLPGAVTATEAFTGWRDAF